MRRNVVMVVRGWWAGWRGGVSVGGRLALGAVVVVLSLVCFSGRAVAGTTVIGFDDLAPGTEVYNQYQGQLQGVSFTQVGGLIPLVTSVGTAVAQSGTQVADIFHCASGATCGEFYTPQASGTFVSPVSSVSLFAGEFPNGAGRATAAVTLTAYDASHNVVAQDQKTVSTDDFRTQLSVSSATADIKFFHVGSIENSNAMGIDDLAFVTPSTPPPPDFALTSSLTGVTVLQGSSASVPIAIDRSPGSSGPIQFSAQNLPAGVTASFSPATVNTETSTTLTLTASTAAAVHQPVTFTVIGHPLSSTAGSQDRTLTLNLDVEHSFTIAAPATIDIPPCGIAQLPISVTRNYYIAPLTLTINGLPAGVTKPSPLPDLGGNAFTQVSVPLTAHGTVSAASPIVVTVTGTDSLGQTTTQTAQVQVTTEAGGITSVAPPAGLLYPPQRVHAGTTLAIKGVGLCPGSKVIIGDITSKSPAEVLAAPPSIAAPADSISPDGRHLQATVPQFATQGALTVVEPDGTQYSWSGPYSVAAYRGTDGFRFGNPHGQPDDYSFDDVQALYGADQTHLGPDLLGPNPCWPWYDCRLPSPFAFAYAGVLNLVLGGHGLCYGMSLTTQRLLTGQLPWSAFPPAITHSVYGKSESATLLHYLKIQHQAQFSAQGIRFWLNAVSRNITFGSSGGLFDTLYHALASGDYPALTLNSYGPGGSPSTPRQHHHVVVAYNLEAPTGQGGASADPSTPVTSAGTLSDFYIDVYDPNVPADPFAENNPWGRQAGDRTSQIEVHADYTYTYLQGKPPGEDYSGNARDIVVEPATLMPATPTAPFTVQGLFYMSQFPGFGSSANPVRVTQVADTKGHRLFMSNGTINVDRATRLPHAAPMPPLIGPGPTAPTGFALRGGGPYTQTLQGTRKGTYGDALIGRDFAFVIAKVATDGGVRDLLSSDAANKTITFRGSQTRDLTARVLARAPANAIRTATIGTTTDARGMDTVGFNHTVDAVAYRHLGSPTTYRLKLTAVGPGQAPATFDTGPLIATAGDTSILTPHDWHHLDTSTAILTISNASGKRTTHLIRNHSTIVKVFRLTGLRVRKHGARSVTVTISTTLSRLIRTTRVVLVWGLSQGRHIIGRHITVLASTTTHTGSRRDSWTFIVRTRGRLQATGIVSAVSTSAEFEAATEKRTAVVRR